MLGARPEVWKRLALSFLADDASDVGVEARRLAESPAYPAHLRRREIEVRLGWVMCLIYITSQGSAFISTQNQLRVADIGRRIRTKVR